MHYSEGCTVNTVNAERPLEVYRFFRDAVQTDFIQFIPIVERATPETISLANQGWGSTGKHAHPLYQQEMAQLLDQDRAPAEVMNLLQMETLVGLRQAIAVAKPGDLARVTVE